MGKFVNVGYGNMVNADRIVAVIGYESAPSKRIVAQAREDGRLIDATQGRRTRGVIITSEDHVITTALLPETIAARHDGQMTGTLIPDTEREEDDE